MVDPTGLEPVEINLQEFVNQCREWHGKFGGVAIDAQISAAWHAVGVLARHEILTGGALTGAARNPTPKGRGPRRSSEPDGKTRKDGETEAAR